MTDISAINFNQPRYYLMRHYNTQDRHAYWMVVDSTIQDGVHTIADTDGIDHHIFKPEAIKSAHYTAEQAQPALDEANAAAWGITVEQMRAERTRRLYADIAEVTGLSVEEVACRAAAMESEAQS